MHKYIHNVTKVMCALYVRCALSVLQKECRKVWGARYRSENTVIFLLLAIADKHHSAASYEQVVRVELETHRHFIHFLPYFMLSLYSPIRLTCVHGMSLHLKLVLV